VFFYTPKIELHIALNVKYSNTLPEVRKRQRVMQAVGEVHKINWRRKLYNASPYHTDVQPIPSTPSSSKLHTLLEEYFAILCRIACFKGSS
jgi:hypothetical protein